MDNEDDKNGLAEKCSVCGKELRDGDGRFRMPDRDFCLECYCKYHPKKNAPE